MKRFSNLMLCATLACCAAAAQASTLKAADVPRITNGGTGFIGVTESAGMPAQPVAVRLGASGTSAIPVRAGEASTIVKGQPNVDPNTPMGMSGDHIKFDARAMGNSAGGFMADFPANAHPGWGTPD